MLKISQITKSFKTKKVLTHVSFALAQGKIMAILGPSGCGKSTLLNIIAGLILPEAGDVSWNGKSLLKVPPHQRGFGLMFQDYALFPHLNVLENVAFGLRMLKLPKRDLKRRVSETLTLVGLSTIEERSVHTLSGGEQQRVALARSLAPRPHLLMLDEPLGSLDRNLRQRLTGELRNILHRLHQTAIYVTHDLEEALALADQIVLMNAGQIEQIGTPQELYYHPETAFTAQFLGLSNQLAGRVTNGNVHTSVGVFPACNQSDGPITVLIRPESANLKGGDSHIHGIIVEQLFQGSYFQVTLDVNGSKLRFDLQGSIPQSGQSLKVYFNPKETLQFLPM